MHLRLVVARMYEMTNMAASTNSQTCVNYLFLKTAEVNGSIYNFHPTFEKQGENTSTFGIGQGINNTLSVTFV